MNSQGFAHLVKTAAGSSVQFLELDASDALTDTCCSAVVLVEGSGSTVRSAAAKNTARYADEKYLFRS